MNRRSCAVLAAAVLLATTAAGCGSDGDDDDAPRGDEAQVTEVIAALEQAARAGDGKRICEDLFTTNLSISVARASGTTCPAEVGENVFAEDARFAVEEVTVDADRATAKVLDQDERPAELLLERAGGTWRIARIG